MVIDSFTVHCDNKGMHIHLYSYYYVIWLNIYHKHFQNMGHLHSDTLKGKYNIENGYIKR